MKFLLYMLVLNVIGAFFWPIIFRRAASGESARPKTTPSPTPSATPTTDDKPRVARTVGRDEGQIEVYTSTVVTDKNNKRAAFDLYTFSKELHWKKGAYVVETIDGVIKTRDEMVTYLSEIHGDMRTYPAVVTVGTASFDLVEKKDEEFEEDRALKRAELLMEWIRPAFKEIDKGLGHSPALYEINLGHYTLFPDTDNQRRLIIFGVQKLDWDVEISEIMSKENQEQLQERLSQKGYPFILTAYSKFEINPGS